MSGSVTETQDAVTAAYVNELGRLPDPGGLATYSALLLSGVPLSQVQSALAQSAKAQADIQNLYMAALGRAADPTGIALDTQALTTGASLAQLRMGIVQSREEQSAIQGLYEGVLGRPADAGGFASITQALLGGATLAQLRSGLAASPEAARAVTAVFQNDLGRAPAAPEVAFYTSALAAGTTLATITSSIILSGESTRNVQSLYQQYLGRPASDTEVQAVQRSLFGGGTLTAVRLGLDAQHRLQVSTVPDQTAALTAAYESVFGHTPAEAPNSSAPTLSTLQTELSLGRPIADVEQVIDYRTQAFNGSYTDSYGYAVPAQYSPNGFSMYLEQASSNLSPATTSLASEVPLQVTGGSGAAGPDTITLDVAQFSMAPLTFIASLDGQSLGQAILAGSSIIGTPSTGQITFVGNFSAGRELDLTIGTIPLNSLYVVSGTLNGQQFLLDGAVNNTGGSIALFPHASSASVVTTYTDPYS